MSSRWGHGLLRVLPHIVSRQRHEGEVDAGFEESRHSSVITLPRLVWCFQSRGLVKELTGYTVPRTFCMTEDVERYACERAVRKHAWFLHSARAVASGMMWQSRFVHTTCR